MTSVASNSDLPITRLPQLARVPEDRHVPKQRRSRQASLPPFHWTLVAALALLTLIIAGHAYSLRLYPAVFVDEGSRGSLYWSLVQQRPEINVHWLFVGDSPDHTGGVQAITVGLAYQAFEPHYVVGRATSLAWGLVLLLLTYLLAAMLVDRRVALFAALALSVSWPFLYTSHLLRPDIVLAVLGLGAVILQLFACRRGLRWAHLLVGPLLVLGYQVHPNAVAFALATGLLYLAHYRRRLLLNPGPWLFVVGLIGSLLVYRFSSSGEAGAQDQLIGPHLQFMLATDKLPPLLAYSPLEMLAAEWLRFVLLLRSSPIELALLVPTLVWTLGHREARDRPLLLVVGAISATFLLLTQNKSAYYLILVYPFLCVLFASTLWAVVHAQKRLQPLRLLVVLAVCWIATSMLWRGAADIVPHLSYDYDYIMQPLREALPPGASVLAEPTYWLALSDHPYVSTWNLNWMYERDGTEPAEIVQWIRPDYVLLDPGFAGSFEPENPFRDTVWERIWTYSQHFVLPGRPEDLLGTGARIEAKLDLPFHGQVWVVRPGWE